MVVQNHFIMITENSLMNVWEGCLRNERQAQALLYKLMAPKMLAVCMRYVTDRDEAQDILQEGFIKVFQNMEYFRREGSLEGWIRRIMVHSAISRFRKRRQLIFADDMGESSLPTEPTFNNSLEAKDLLKMIQQLPDTYRSVFNLYAVEGYSHQEIGQMLGMTELLSRTSLHRARTILKTRISKMEMAQAS
jgi:RNA polymerase sigma-70 factor (ECF subfamily)